MKTFNSRLLKSRRQDLRNNATLQEIRLWSRLRGDQLGYRFRRQYSIGKYIVDFYCPARRVVIELDGSQHFELEAEKYDKRRTAFLEKLGCTVLRFTDGEVNTNSEGILLKIMEVLRTPPQSPSPREGEAGVSRIPR